MFVLKNRIVILGTSYKMASKAVVVEETPDPLQMDMKAIGKLKIPKLREIYIIHCEELERIKLEGLQIQEERQKLSLQVESTAAECEQLERDIQEQAGVSARLEIPFEEERLQGDVKLRYNELQYENTFSKARKVMHRIKCKAKRAFVDEMLDITTLDKHDCRLKILQNRLMEELDNAEDPEIYHSSDDDSEETAEEEEEEGGDNLEEEEESNENGDMDEIQKDDYDDTKDRVDLELIKETLRKQEELWQDFVKDTHKDAYYRILGPLESLKENTLADQQAILKEQFEKILQLKQEIEIKSRVMKEIDEIRTSNIITDPPPPAKQRYINIEKPWKPHYSSTDSPYYKTLIKKKENLIKSVLKKEQTIQKLLELLDDQDINKEVADYLDIRLNNALAS